MASPVGFTYPLFLLLLPVLSLFWLRQRGVRQRYARTRRAGSGLPRTTLLLRLLVASFLVLSLAGLRLPTRARSVATIFVLDVSDSVPGDLREGAKAWIRDALRAQGPDDRAAIITVGRTAQVEQPLSAAHDHPTWGELPRGDVTNLAAGLQLAADLLPPRGAGTLRRIVLLSDGNETHGDALQTLRRPGLQDVEVGVRALPQRLQDTAITEFVAPAALREGEPAELHVGIVSPLSQQGTLRVWANDHLLTERTVGLLVGPNDAVVTTGPLATGFWTFHATIDVPDDSLPQNNESWAFSVVGAPAHILLVEGTPGAADAVREALRAARIVVDTSPPQALPADGAAFADYDAVVLANVPATALTPTQLRALQRAVADQGKGLVAIGGDHAFGLGGYAGTPLEATLPVSLQPPQGHQVASLALVLVIDRSGSMSTTDTLDRKATRLDLAKEGAIEALHTLQLGDQVAVIAFDSSASWVATLRTLGTPDDVAAVTDRIAAINVGGGTEFLPPLQMAYQALQRTPARIKHVIFMTDGEAPEFGLPQLLAAMRRAGITVSTLGVSGDISGPGRAVLARIADAGQGRAYFTNTPNDVPQIMTQEARVAAQSAKQERDFTPHVVVPASALTGLVPAAFPPLHGYVRTSAKPAAEVVLSTDGPDPLLVQWQYGLGRAAAWMADAQGPWSKDWVGTESFARLWPQLVRWSAPAPVATEAIGLHVTVTGDGEVAAIRVEAVEPTGQFRNLVQTAVDVSRPDGSGVRVPLPQVAPGMYAGQVALSGPGVYAIQVSQTDANGQLLAQTTTGYALPYSPEFRRSLANRALLERLVAESGGPIMNRPQDAWRRDTAHALLPQSVAGELLAAALVLFVADIALRRLRPTPADLALAGRGASARSRRLVETLGAAWRRFPGPTIPSLAGSGRRRGP